MTSALQAFNDNPSQPSVFQKNGQVMTNSRDVAAFFGKQHKNVLRDIDNLDCSDDFTGLNFELSEYKDGSGRKLRSLNMTKDGFTFLVMGFTGKEAARFKEAYISQFNAMEATLRAVPEELMRSLGIIKTVVKKVTAIEKSMAEWESLFESTRREQEAATMTLAEQVRDMMLGTSSRVAALEYVSVRELLIEAKAVQKGRGGLNRKIGARLRAKALQDTPPAQVRRCPHSNVWLFPRDFADRFMRETGSELVAEHNDRQNGQGRFDLVRKSKGQKVVSITPKQGD